jgi:hypothetical protein
MFQNWIATHARHHHVEDDQIGPHPIDHFTRLATVACLKHFVALAFKDKAQAIAEFGVVINDQNGSLQGHG